MLKIQEKIMNTIESIIVLVILGSLVVKILLVIIGKFTGKELYTPPSSSESLFSSPKTEHVWLCSNCKTVLTGIEHPRDLGCPVGNNGHLWNDMGESGNHRYQCSKCGTIIYTKENPGTHGPNVKCPNNPYGAHVWNEV
jgi:DNA-directed RNA polymerase subunit RPC12/RpoP